MRRIGSIQIQWVYAIVISIGQAAGLANIKVSGMFSDNMVLQQKTTAPVWGWATPGEKVIVKGDWPGGHAFSEFSDSGGKWMVDIETPDAGGPYSVKITSGSENVYLNNVMVGEVWFCSGQSNMEMPLKGWPEQNQPIHNSGHEILHANYPLIRLFKVKRHCAEELVQDCEGIWRVCTPASAEEFSAVAYFFGNQIHDKLNVPVGLILCAWSATPVESWIRRDAQDSFFRKVVESSKYNDVPPQRKPGRLYNGMVAPVIPYRIRGIIWYQGESNVGRAMEYEKLFQVLIQDWRKIWCKEDIWFLFVQLANYRPKLECPQASDWAELREAQAAALHVPKTAMAVTIDLGEAGNIHPANKQDVGQRLALCALANTYNRKAPCYGPSYDNVSLEEKKVIIKFKNYGKGLSTPGHEPVTGFTVAGSDGNFVCANAAIISPSTVKIHSDVVDYPVVVRYAWADNPVCNLQNSFGLPAPPFRIDCRNVNLN